MTTKSQKSPPQGLPDYQFSSGLASAIFRCLPGVSTRGACFVGSALFRALPGLNHGVTMRVGESSFRLDLRYRSQLALLFGGFELAETAFVVQHLSEGDIYFDLGSNWGYFTALASSVVGLSGLVVAVEANPKVFARLVSLVHQSGVRNVLPLNFALSDVSGQSVTIKHSWYRNDTGGFIRPDSAGNQGGIVSKSLDDLWRQLGRPNVRMVKIDVEGVEPLVLRGGTLFFSQGVTDFVQVEVNEWTLSRSDLHYSFIYELMERFGFPHAYLMSLAGSDLSFRTVRGDALPSGCNVMFSRQPIS